jgi:hypothetical protein
MRSPHNSPISIEYDDLQMIAFGGSAVVCGIDERTVLKEYYDKGDDAFDSERNAFDRLGPHTNIVNYIGQYNSKFIILERGKRVQQLYALRSFPDVSQLALSDVMLGCWYNTLQSMDDIIEPLESRQSRAEKVSAQTPPSGASWTTQEPTLDQSPFCARGAD